MVTTLYLLTGLLAAAQVVPSTPPVRPPTPPGLSGDWLLAPRLVPGQELVYRGDFVEQAGSGQVQLNRHYRLEERAFVLEAGPRGVEFAVLTLLRDQAVAGGGPLERVALKPAEVPARSVRLERVAFDLTGRPQPSPGVSVTVPLEGPPLLECGFCAAVPAGRLGLDRPWTVSEPGRPDMTWRVKATEIVGGTSCLRLEGVQQSDDWEKGKPDRLAWRRLDTVWIAPRTGMAQRVERRIEHRLAGRVDPTHVSTLRYELQSALQYPATLADDRRRELTQALALVQSARPILKDPGLNGSRIDVTLARVKATHDAHAATPYREALAHLMQRLELAKRGELPPALPAEVVAPEPPPERGLHVGKPAPDFVSAELNHSGRTAGLRQWRGRPVLMVFFNPDSRSLDELMDMVNTLAGKQPDVQVVALAMTAEVGKVEQLRASRGWKMPVLSGGGLRVSYEVEHTPKLVLIDADGNVQGSVVGWGVETPSEVRACLPRWLRR